MLFGCNEAHFHPYVSLFLDFLGKAVLIPITGKGLVVLVS